MWIIEVDENESVHNKLFLKGPKCVIGRATECDLPFPNDKSISRKHIEIYVNEVQGKCVVSVVDLGSKFGSILNDRKLDANQVYELTLDRVNVLKLGVMETTLRIYSESLSFCISRLEKAEKEKVKNYGHIIDAQIVKTVEAATHLITSSSWAATAKSLLSIVLQKPIVSVNWLHFIDESKCLVPIPNFEDYFPSTEKVVEYRLKESRRNLCKNLLVLLADESVEQYGPILSECGAMVLQAWQYSSKTQMKNLTSLIADILKSNSLMKICFFIDETKAVSDQLFAFARTSKFEIHWLTDGALAFSILSLATPPLTKEMPSIADSECVVESVVEDQVPIQNRDYTSSYTETAQSAIIHEQNHIPNVTPAKRSKQEDNDDDEILQRATKRVRKVVPSQRAVDASIVDLSSSLDNIPDKAKAKLIDVKKENQTDGVKNSVEPQSTRSSSKLSGNVKDRAAKRAEEEEDEEILLRGNENSRTSQKAAAKDNQPFDFFEEELKTEIAPALGKRKRPAVAVASRSSANSMDGNFDDVFELRDQSSKPNQIATLTIFDNIVEPVRKFIASDEWVAVNRGMNIIQLKEDDQAAVVEERKFVLIEAVDSSKPAFRRKKDALKPCKDVRKFVKNFVREVHVTDLIKSKLMEKVLPKESEREVQLRLEYEAELAQQQIADKLLIDNVTTGSKGKKRSG